MFYILSLISLIFFFLAAILGKVRIPIKKTLNLIPFLSLNDYKLLEVLGEGGFGRVFKAFNNKDRTYAALKYLKEPTQEKVSEILAEDFILEKIEEIKYYGFLKYLGVFKDPNNPNGLILGMESGRLTVKHVLQMIKRFEEREVIYIVSEVLKQLIVLRKNGICNRDIKPENIIIVQEKERILFKISDFGAGCVIDPKNANLIPSEELLACSGKYASPEVLDIMEDYGPENYDPYKGDVYSLALSIMEMLGHPVNREFDKPEFLLNDVIKKMIEPDPKTRLSLFELEIHLQKLAESNSKNIQTLFEKINKVLLSWDEFQSDRKVEVSVDEFISTSISNAKAYFDICQFELCLKNLEKCDELYNNKKGLNLDCQSQVYYELGRVYSIISKYNKSEEYYKKSLEIRKQIFGEQHVATAQTYNNLGLFYKDAKGNLELSREYILKALKIRENLFKKPHPDLANSFVTYGNWLKAYGKEREEFYQALEYFDKGLNIYVEIHGEDHSEVASTYNLMGCLFMENLQSYSRAEDCLRESLKINLKIFGELNLSTAVSYNNLANVFKRNGDLIQAEQYYKLGLNIFVEICGQDHRDVATLFDNLGVFYQEIGNRKNSEEFLLKGLKIRQAKLGENHLETSYSYHNLAFFHSEKSAFEKAIELYLKSLKIKINVLGDKHPDVAKGYNDLAILYKKKGNFNEAETFYLKSLQIRLDCYGENNLEVASSLNNLGHFYSQIRNDKKTAGDYYARRLLILEAFYEPDDPYLLKEYGDFSIFCRSELNDLKKADEYSEKSTYICRNMRIKEVKG